MKQNCKNCVYYRNIERWSYNGHGCDHIQLDGFACTVFSYDFQKIIWMDADPEAEVVCECFEYCKKVGAENENNA